MRSKRWWLATAVVAVVAFGAGFVTSRYEDYQKPHFTPEAAHIDTFAMGASDDSDLRLFATVGAGDMLDAPVVTEHADRILVTLRSFRFVPAHPGFKNLAGYRVQTRAFLREALGARLVIDATTGKVVPRSPNEP
jgi:hypothetical protein